uniref:T9SS type A sorting domain-containing protein n=1 Tax=uncultured Draconibacterium sp. TaxID=1573823 RepID=UPI003217CE26
MIRILLPLVLLFFIPFPGMANKLCVSDTILIKKNDLSVLLKSRNYLEKSDFINQLYPTDYRSSLKSYSNDLKLDSVVVSEWKEETEEFEKSYLYICDFENEGKSVVVKIYYWDTERIKWRINDENYYDFDANNRLKQVEFQNYFLPNYRLYTRVYYEYENGLLKTESHYDRVDEIEFWNEIEQVEYLYNADSSLNTVNVKEWDIFENDWITYAYTSFAYDSIGNLETETGFDYNFYDVESTKKFEVQYSYDDDNNLIEIVKYVPGAGEGVFEEEMKQENFYNASSELEAEIFYNWDFDLKIWLKDTRKLYVNEASGIKLFEESSYAWDEKNSSWEGSNKTEYLSEYNYFSEDIQNWEFMKIYLPAFSFNGVVCDKVEDTRWDIDTWINVSNTNYYFSKDTVVGIEYSGTREISLYPNPVVNALTIKTNILFETTCTVRDLNGRIISQTNFQNNAQIDMSYLKPGIYIVELYSENERIYVDKVIRN